tara:strand:- start:100 stop:375 length:276 start_codon:yes stop_codon:yes gene_type:complete
MKKVIPVGTKVLIKQAEATEFYGNTKILVNPGSQELECKGTIIAVGEQVSSMKPGDYIQFADHAIPVAMIHNGEEHLLINIQDILALIVDV